jgi:hypothetical protein
MCVNTQVCMCGYSYIVLSLKESTYPLELQQKNPQSDNCW